MKKAKISDQRVVTIINDPLLPGKEKARRIGQLIKSRKQIPVQTSLVETDKAHQLKGAWIPDGFDSNGIEVFVGINYCAECRLANIAVSQTNHTDSKPRIARSQIRLTTAPLRVSAKVAAMAKLVEGFPEKWLVDTGGEEIPLREFCRTARLKAGMSMGKLNLKSGLGHPTVNNYESGKYNALPSMLVALMTLGYEIEIKPPGVRDG